MNGTPRVNAGGFPRTPGTVAPQQPDQQQQPRTRNPLPQAPENVGQAGPATQPVIPLNIVDAPSQRLYAFAIYVGLFAWRFYDWVQMLEDNGSSFYFFTKWIFFDFVYLFTLPSLRIPWLELSNPAVLSIFSVHFLFNWLLMFNIPVPWHAWLLGIVKLFYDSGELSISERNVKVSSILHNHSLIMGKQIINILPEGSARLNPEKKPYCLGQGRDVVTIPIYFNATVPVEVELIRIDLETNAEEVVKLSRSQIREIHKQSKRGNDDGEQYYTYNIPIKKPGVYQLERVLDEYKLEVQRLTTPTYVVPCPKARVRTAESSTRCIGELSDLSLEVHGTPPLKIVYSRSINGQDHGFHYQSLQPDGFSSPLIGAQRSILPGQENYSWARAQSVSVSLNESMTTSGEWQYNIGEVHDIFGNVMNYTLLDESDIRPRPKHLYQNFVVRDRPRATLVGCDLRSPLKVAKGRSTRLPVKIGRPGKTPDSVSHTVTWQFSPIGSLSKNGDHGDVVEVGSFTAKSANDQPTISAPGLYTLKSVSCDSCEGEIQEPSSCMLLNPPEPQLSVHAEEIPDKCADEYHLEQNVKPPATAFFLQGSESLQACLDEPVKVEVKMLGDGPFTLEWELIHERKRKAEKISNIDEDVFLIETPPLSSGVHLPLRLSGDGPWRVSYRNSDGSGETQTRVARSGNDYIEVKDRGTYEILDVRDNLCPGTVDLKAPTFQVDWFPRPELSFVSNDAVKAIGKDTEFIKDDVCEGDVDGFEIALKGSPPYHVQYEVKYKPKSGSGSVSRKEFDAALGKASISMDTVKPGQYQYTFSALSDNLYNSDKKQPQQLVVQQTVNAKPTASFVRPGQTLKMCMSEQDHEERIPINLEGIAPFYVELEIKHHAGVFPEIFRISDIPTSSYGIQIPRSYLKLGAQQVRIRNVRDARGCQTKTEIGGPAVNIQLFDAPAIYPLEQRMDYCVGERIAYTLSGTPPFEVHYTFDGAQKKAKSPTTNFRRIAEAPGAFAITSISDKTSDCRASVHLAKTIHAMPSVRISKGRVLQVDIHEGSEVEILFEFWGTPPFEFTYTRSSNARKGHKSQVLETRHDVSYDHSKAITASLEGTYEVVAIKDKFCAFSTMGVEGGGDKAQKLLQF
ncbi:putative nucleoporin pom152 protein [Eutypa lata UCREL1]|uniref:Putative nucleoporin pom152 protein n=1 Tax=Eutypa lata (strain UCR-EL1) TaxID=1287681 RepID=M7SH32_EUTLA|nr:putative nucleoporin pom152 protein [Eutypa lata UCREL1]